MFEVAPVFVDLIDALDPHAAAEWLFRERGICRKPTSLAKLRSVGGGPKFFNVDGAIRYLPRDLDAYARSLVRGPLQSSRELATTNTHDQKNGPLEPRMFEGPKTAHSIRNLTNRGDSPHLRNRNRLRKAVSPSRDGHANDPYV